jgi:hypothetical protein
MELVGIGLAVREPVSTRIRLIQTALARFIEFFPTWNSILA